MTREELGRLVLASNGQEALAKLTEHLGDEKQIGDRYTIDIYDPSEDSLVNTSPFLPFTSDLPIGEAEVTGVFIKNIGRRT